ncbi:Ribosomal protein L46 [Trinorchestia longiramus]|nr:Ribosomal protein L46 [Trinorchestia longiramus]
MFSLVGVHVLKCLNFIVDVTKFTGFADLMMRYSLLSFIRNVGVSRVLTANLQLGHSQGQVVSSATRDVADPAEPVSLGNKGIGGWQIMAAVCVTRHPVLCPPLSPMEHTYSQHLQQLDFEQSLQSDFELQVIEDKARKVLGADEEAELLDDEAKDTRSALEQLDFWKEEREQFEKRRVFEVSVPENSLGRSLSRQTSERVVAESFDPSLGVRVMGNAPVGFYKYKYPKEMRSHGYIGAKVFFYRGQVGYRVRRSLPILQQAHNKTQLWLTHQQITEKLQQNYVKAITQFLIDDS